MKKRPLIELPKRLILNALNVKSRGEATGHLECRQVFVPRLIDDARTRERFARWRHASGLDVLVAELQRQFEGLPVKARVGILDGEEGERRALAPEHLRIVDSWLRLFRDGYQAGLDARATDTAAFLHELQLPPCPWLRVDLLDAFENDLAHALGVGPRNRFATVTTTTDAPKGRAPQRAREPGGVPPLVRDTDWLYRHRVQDPPDTIPVLAREYVEKQNRARAERDRVPLEPKDYNGEDDTKIVRAGIERAWHLLFELPADPVKLVKEIAFVERKGRRVRFR